MPRPAVLLAPVLSALTFVTPALAQLSALEPKAPPPLPDPPWLSHYFLESPILFIALLAAAAFTAYLILNSLKKPRQAKQAMFSLLALAILSGVTAWLVHTPREKAIELSRQLVAAVAAGDTRAVDAALAPNAALYIQDLTKGQPKEIILQRVATTFAPGGQYHIDDVGLLEIQAFVPTSDLAQIQVKVRTTAGGYPVISWWQLDLSPKPGGGWQAVGIRYFSSNVSGSFSG